MVARCAKTIGSVGAVLLALTVPAAQADQPASADARCIKALAGVRTLVGEAAGKRVAAALETEAGTLQNAAWLPGYCQALSENIAAKLASAREGVAFDDRTLIDTAVRYEAFRVTAFRNAGVSPKRYYGFLDGHGATAAYERQLLDVATRVSALLNAYAAKQGLKITVTPKEIVVTQISEGGALLLGEKFGEVDRVHPVFGVGLDDYRIGLVRFPGLIDEVDRAFGSRLGQLKGARDDTLTFVESILGTAAMYLYEKDIAETKRLAANVPSLATLPLDEQFVHASLVYNSGILFSDERARQMMAFDTGAYLVEVSEKTADRRPRLPVMLPAAADAWLAEGKALPSQPTSWNAVYHVMQRYGAWVALGRFSSAFTPSGDVAASVAR